MDLDFAISVGDIFQNALFSVFYDSVDQASLFLCIAPFSNLQSYDTYTAFVSQIPTPLCIPTA